MGNFTIINEKINSIDKDSEALSHMTKEYVLFLDKNSKILKDFSKWLKNDKSVGIYFCDYIKDTVPIFHVGFPRNAQDFPFIFVSVAKLKEAIESPEPNLSYLTSRYISVHIPELTCEIA